MPCIRSRDDDLEYLKSRLPGFSGYEDEASRHIADGQVRAFAGETLARLREQIAATLSLVDSERLDALVLRCGFLDRRYIAALAHADLDAIGLACLAEHDRAIVESVAPIADGDATDLPAVIDRLNELFDSRRVPPAGIITGRFS
ncbi:MAG TPA: hypothetical protein VGZ00_02105 [Candidatus Baltobacteraceae bacterium]|jgi:hypothetical protein|nr:hypothetical protein [Candidatus Baltobacteraceae bacterium]